LSLIDYAKTDRHRESLQVWEDCGRNSAKAAAILGISQSTMRDYVSITKNNAAAAGYRRIGMQDATFQKAR
jgi:predicted transcriptional regulator